MKDNFLGIVAILFLIVMCNKTPKGVVKELGEIVGASAVDKTIIVPILNWLSLIPEDKVSRTDKEGEIDVLIDGIENIFRRINLIELASANELRSEADFLTLRENLKNQRRLCTLELVENHGEIRAYPKQIDWILGCLRDKGISENNIAFVEIDKKYGWGNLPSSK
jgi:hypothetical protein